MSNTTAAEITAAARTHLREFGNRDLKYLAPECHAELARLAAEQDARDAAIDAQDDIDVMASDRRSDRDAR